MGRRLRALVSRVAGSPVSAESIVQDGEIRYYAAVEPRPAVRTDMSILSWNIAYARGANPDNSVNETGGRRAVERRLQQMGALIRELEVDVVLLQEVDFGCRRSHHLDQLEILADSAGFSHAAPVVSWRARYVPYPYWPPTKHYGGVLSGGAVLSRFPVLSNRYCLHAQPAANPWWYNVFYLRRYTQFVTLGFGEERLVVVNNHLEAFDRVNRSQQARWLVRAVRDCAAVWVVGGDMNMVPPEAARRHDFSDPDGDDYRNDNSQKYLRERLGMVDVVPVEDYLANETQHFTFPSEKPNRRLDYLYVCPTCKVLDYAVVPTAEFSDHRPVWARLSLPRRRR